MKHLAILGASGHGKVVADCAECAGWSDVVFFDDAWPKLKENGVWHVVGDTGNLLRNLHRYDGVIVAIGDNEMRLKKQNELLERAANVVSVIHPHARVSRYMKLGIGSVVMAGAVVNVDSRLGSGCIINTGATIDHDCVLGDGVHVSPGAHLAGGVVVGDRSWVGIGSSIRQLIEVGENTIIGAGAAVVKNITGNCTVSGIPAMLLEHKNKLNR